MSQFTVLTLNDSEATPVSHTFNPQNNIAGLSKWRDSNDTLVVGLRPYTSMSIREGSAKVSRKVTVKFAVPFQPATVDGITPAVKTVEIIVTALVPLDAPVASIADVRTYMSQMLLYQSQVEDAIQNGNTPY